MIGVGLWKTIKMNCLNSHHAARLNRYYGRQILLFLSSHPDFDTLLEKYIPSKDLQTVRDSVFALKTRVGGCFSEHTPFLLYLTWLPGVSGSWRDAPRHSVSEREALPPWQRHSPGLLSQQRAAPPKQQVGVTIKDCTNVKLVPEYWIGTFQTSSRESRSHPSCRTQAKSIADKTEYIQQISGLLASKDFKDRIKGIDQLVADCQDNPNMVINSMFPVSRDIFCSHLSHNSDEFPHWGFHCSSCYFLL